ncbi:M48 family metalloprotease [Ferrovibrio sp.]|uniref:M48 family metalloprotease n=1 Tax=Ferrovibrio sp. TaxID=1917215 RepID=UPI0035AE2F69
MKLLRGLVLLCALLALPVCGPAQAQIFMSPEKAKQVGAEEHPKILKEFGGVYDDPEIGAYVATIAGRLAGQSGIPAGDFHFTVLDSPVVNAFALPGGYVYITRGTLALANNEAEAGAVLGHEIGHVVAKHSEQRYDRAIGTNILTAGGAILGSIFLGQGAGDLIGQVGSVAGGAYLAGFSRENEFEADLIGLRLLGHVGYAPIAAAGFLQSLSDYSDLETRIAGQAGRDRTMDMFATHPRGPDRVQRAMDEAQSQPAHPIYRRDEYLDRINGLLYGDDPKQGVVRGNTFSHPDLRLSFTAPDGWRIINRPDAVLVRGPDSIGQLQFDMERDKRKRDSARDMLDYITRSWANNLRFSSTDRFDVNGMPAALGASRIQSKDGSTLDVRLVAVRMPDGQIVRFVISARPQSMAGIEPSMIRAVHSLRYLTPDQAKAIQPLRLKVINAQAGDTSDTLARRMPAGNFQRERFRVLNGLREGEEIRPGERVKIVE